jgi:hypothetical protein
MIRMIAGISVIALIWVNIGPDYHPSPLKIAAMAPYFVLVTILTGRVHRNTKLGLYNMVSQQWKSLPQVTSYMLPGNTHPAAKPIPIVVSNVDDHRSDYSMTRWRGSLDFGFVKDI